MPRRKLFFHQNCGDAVFPSQMLQTCGYHGAVSTQIYDWNAHSTTADLKLYFCGKIILSKAQIIKNLLRKNIDGWARLLKLMMLLIYPRSIIEIYVALGWELLQAPLIHCFINIAQIIILEAFKAVNFHVFINRMKVYENKTQADLQFLAQRGKHYASVNCRKTAKNALASYSAKCHLPLS